MQEAFGNAGIELGARSLEPGRDVIVPNQTLRSSYYAEPAGASTGIPLPYLALEDLMVEVEIIAMVR